MKNLIFCLLIALASCEATDEIAPVTDENDFDFSLVPETLIYEDSPFYTDPLADIHISDTPFLNGERHGVNILYEVSLNAERVDVNSLGTLILEQIDPGEAVWVSVKVTNLFTEVAVDFDSVFVFLAE